MVPRAKDLTAAFFAGAWRAERRLFCRRTRQSGSFRGNALFIPRPGGLAFTETGTLAFGAFSGPARQAYRFEGVGPLRVLFADGRPFHTLDLTTGCATVAHHCPPDAYRGRYRLLGPAAWTLVWLIDGPRKSVILRTRYTRT